MFTSRFRFSQSFVGLTVLASLGTPSLAQPLVRDRGLLPGDATIGLAPNSQSDLAIARGGDQFLVAWSDGRARNSGSQTIQSDTDIFGIRLDNNGNPLDPAPFLIAGGMGYQRRPIIGWNGENFLVAFESQDPTLPPVTYFETRIRFMRVSSAGQALDPVPLSLPRTAFELDTIGLTISGNGGHWLIARCIYHSDGYGTFLAGQRISATGQLLDPTPVMLNDWVYGPLQVVAANGEYMVVGPDWNNGAQLKARRIGANLQPLAPSFNLRPDAFAVGTSGTEFYVTWIANFTDIVGSRMTNTGVLLNPAGTMLFPNFSGDIDIAHDGSSWWLSRTISNIASLLRLDANGNRLDPVGGVQLPISVSGSVNSLYDNRLAPRAGGGVLYAWTDLREANGNDQNAFVLPVSSSNAPGAEVAISTSTRNQRQAESALGPNADLAVAFISELANDGRVLVHRLDAQGQPRESEPVEVAQAPTVGSVGIAWTGSAYVIAWSQSGGVSAPGIYARRMNPDGSFLDHAFFVMPGMAASVEALQGHFCIAATRFASYPQFIDLWIKRFDANANPIDPANGLLISGGYHNGITRTRTDGTQWLVTSHSQWTHNSSQADAVLARIPLSGTPAPGFNPTPYSGASGDPDLAFSGSNYLLVWRMNSLANANNYIMGRIMNTDGTYGPAFTIAEAAGRQLRPTVSWDGSNFLVAWDDQRNQAQFYDDRTDVYAIRVRQNGTLLDAQPFQIASGGNTAECSPSLISSNGVTFASSTRFITSPSFDSYRIGLTLVGTPPCVADMDNGTGTGTPDGGVTIDDLLFYLNVFEAGVPRADVDNGSFTGTPDGGVTIDDLLYFLFRFEGGC